MDTTKRTIALVGLSGLTGTILDQRKAKTLQPTRVASGDQWNAIHATIHPYDTTGMDG
jgi:hypothetical protein